MNESIGNRISKYRKEKGLTQEELATKLGVSSQAVSKWENDASCPDISLLPQLCRTLGISSDELLTGNSNEVKLVPVEQRKSLDELTLRIRINSADGDKVKVNLPMSLVKVAMEIGGWADDQTMHKIYTHISEKSVSTAAKAFTNFFAPPQDVQETENGNKNGNAE